MSGLSQRSGNPATYIWAFRFRASALSRRLSYLITVCPSVLFARSLVPHRKTNISLSLSGLLSIVGSLRDREVACSASDRQGSNFESCVWRTVSSQSSHHPQEVLLAQFSLYVHKGGLKPDSFHFCQHCHSHQILKFPDISLTQFQFFLTKTIWYY